MGNKQNPIMTTPWFCSDLHLGHVKIAKFRHTFGFNDEEEHALYICDSIANNVKEKDILYILGDVAFTEAGLVRLKKLPGRKILIRGNHDLLHRQLYMDIFEDIYGLLKYKQFWLSHAPIHPAELRDRINLHGHVHYSTIDDTRYFNCCPENVQLLVKRPLITLDEVIRLTTKI